LRGISWVVCDIGGLDGVGHAGLPFATVFIVRATDEIIRSVSRTKARAFDAVPKMGVGLPEPACRSWLQQAAEKCLKSG
jgi:hypothetical protein